GVFFQPETQHQHSHRQQRTTVESAIVGQCNQPQKGLTFDQFLIKEIKNIRINRQPESMINGNIPGKKQREADNIQQHYLRQIFNHIFSNYLTEKRRQPYAVVAKRSFNSALCKAFQSASLLEISSI